MQQERWKTAGARRVRDGHVRPKEDVACRQKKRNVQEGITCYDKRGVVCILGVKARKQEQEVKQCNKKKRKWKGEAVRTKTSLHQTASESSLPVIFVSDVDPSLGDGVAAGLIDGPLNWPSPPCAIQRACISSTG